MKKNYSAPKTLAISIDESELLAASVQKYQKEDSYISEFETQQKQIAALEARIKELQEEQKKNLPESINPKDRWKIYGIDLKECPNERWDFKQVETVKAGVKMETFSYKIPGYKADIYNHALPFASVQAAIISDGQANFCFCNIPLDREKALDIIFAFVRNFVKNGNYTHEECESEYENQLEGDNYKSLKIKSTSDDDISFLLSFTGDEMSAVIYTKLECQNKPKVAEDYVPDMYEVFKKNIEMVRMCIGMCHIHGERCGTEELVEQMNQIAFYVIKREELPAKDRAITSILPKDTSLFLKETGDNFVVTTEDGTRLGFCPTGLYLGLREMNANGFIKEAKIYDNNNGDIAVIVTFEM